MSKAHRQTTDLQSRRNGQKEYAEKHPMELENDFVTGTQNTPSKIPGEVLDIARLLARIAVDNYFSEAGPNPLG